MKTESVHIPEQARAYVKHSFSLSRKARDQSDTKHDFWPQPAQFGAEAYGVCAAMAAFHAEPMKNGKKATFIIFQTPEEGIGIPLSMTGFKEGFDALP
jgi:invasion protein IalB